MTATTTAPDRTARATFHPLTVAAVESLTEDSAAVTFDVPDDLRDAFAFHAGQSLTLRRVITVETALGRSSRPEQLFGLLERSGFELPESLTQQEPGQSLRIAAEA